jgi:hypothetical protein
MPKIYVSPDSIKPDKKDVPLKADKREKSSIMPENVESLKGHNHNPLSAFCYFPHNVEFINEEPGEEVVLLVRRHLITNAGWILLVIAMAFAPLAIKFFPLLDFLPLRFQLVSILFWYLLILAIAIQGFLGWFFSVNIVTNKRVIDVDFVNLIYRKITDAEISHIEDATVEMGSVVRTLFDYGDIVIQTAAEIPEVTFDAVPHPDRIDKILSDLRLKV